MATPSVQVHPRDPALHQALRLAALFAAVKLALHIAANLWEAHSGALPPAQRAVTGISCNNYGEAGAINFLGPLENLGLPTASSGQNNFFLRGPGPTDWDSMILIEQSSVEHLHMYYNSVQIVGHTGTPYSMPFEYKTIYLVSGRKFDIADVWPKKKFYI